MDDAYSPSSIHVASSAAAQSVVHSAPQRRRRPTSPEGKAKREAALKPYGDAFHQDKLAGRWKGAE